VEDALCRLVLLGLLPALAEADLAAFGEALADFNLRVGEMFAPVQGGPYSNPRIGELVEFIRREGVPGAGQSSWGPAVFAIVAAERANDLVRRVRNHFGFSTDQVIITTARNSPALASDN
jgi:predicted sugar kinase